jgi:hypothetical protein
MQINPGWTTRGKKRGLLTSYWLSLLSDGYRGEFLNDDYCAILLHFEFVAIAIIIDCLTLLNKINLIVICIATIVLLNNTSCELLLDLFTIILAGF